MSLYLSRVNKLREELKKQEIDFYLVRDKSNLFYLLKKEIEGYLLIFRKEEPSILISDSRYNLELQELKSRELNIYVFKKHHLEKLFNIFDSVRRKKILALEPNLPLETYLKLKPRVKKIGLKISPLLRKLRMIKEQEEIDKIRSAVRVTTSAVAKISKMLNLKTEREIQALLEFEFRKRGAEGGAFPAIVAGGRRSSYPHAIANKYLIAKKDAFVLLDCGAKFEGYCSDLTRMIFWDKIPRVIKKAYRVVEEAQRLAISLIKEGIKVREVVLKVEQFLKGRGYAKNIFHGLGHGIGLDVHEEPVLDRNSKEILKPGMVITIEPGLYFPGVGGVRKEDMFLVQKDKLVKLI